VRKTASDFKQTSSITGRLRTVTVIIAVFFLLEFVALFISSSAFFNGLTHLHDLNHTGEIMRQAREAVTALRDSVEKAEQQPLNSDLQSIIATGSAEAEDLILQAQAERRKTRAEAHFMDDALVSFREFRKILNSSAPTAPAAQGLLANQYLAETIDSLSKAQIRVNEDSTTVFNEVSRTRYRPITVGIALALVFIALILAIGLLTARRIGNSVQSLVDAAKEVGSGNFQFTPPKVEADEIGFLADAFSQMAQSLSATTVSRNYVINVIDSMRDIVLFLEPNGAIRRANQRTPEILGYESEDLIGQSLLSLFPDGLPSMTELKNFEADAVKKNGLRVEVSVSIAPLSSEARLDAGGFVCVIGDITVRKRNEALIESRNLALASANRELEAFSYSVSHDLRTPLRALDGFSHALLEDYGSTLDADGKRYLDRIRSASQTMGKLIDDLLNLSRLSRAEMKHIQIDLSEMAKDIVAGIREREPLRDVEIFIQEKLNAVGDPALLRIVLSNLFENAWKYSSKTQSAKIDFGQAVNAGKEAFFVKDNGAGFNMEYSKKLFGAFQRLHTASEFPGTGVGLATVLRIIRRHDGDAWAIGEVGRGATFFFTLPEA
jgi:PAS domain S-box-containing protein